MVAEAETRRETVTRIVRKTLRSEGRMTPLLERVLKKRCTVVVPREVVATREVAVATRAAVAAASETAVTVRKAVVVTVTVGPPETVVVTDHTQEEDSVAVVDPRYPLLLKAGKASCFQTILGSKLRIKATLSTFTMLSMAYSIAEITGLKLLRALPSNSRRSSAFISHMAAKFTALPD
jgi:ribonuclease PH